MWPGVLLQSCGTFGRHKNLLTYQKIPSCVASYATEANLTCYQCVRQDYEECGNDTLLPCPPTKDRCVTHIAKDKEKGLVVKRECGLGPCGFDDSNMNRGLGLDGCDRSKDEFFCLSCCTTSGCNKSAARRPCAPPPPLLLALALLLLPLGPPLAVTSPRHSGAPF